MSVLELSLLTNTLYRFMTRTTWVPPKFYISSLNDHYVEVETTDTFKFRATIAPDYSDKNSLRKSIVQQNTSLKGPTNSEINMWGFEIVDGLEHEHREWNTIQFKD